MKPGRDVVILTALLLITTVVAGWMKARGAASWLEAVSFVTGALCVWLTVKESPWNFPISLLNVATFAVVYFNARLFADSGLQVVYFLLTLIGWHQWLYGGAGRTQLRISPVPKPELAIVLLAGAVMTAGLTMYLRHVAGSLPFWDALTTSLSLCAQWLLNRKYLQTWYFWIAVDVLYIPILAYKQLYLTSFLYAVFLAMAAMGLLEWRRRYRAQLAAPGGLPVLQEAK